MENNYHDTVLIEMNENPETFVIAFKCFLDLLSPQSQIKVTVVYSIITT